ncbi:MAG: class I SAM-dependent methyltransferase [Elusimicrobia bacterium]|nr:class I SAM-dependent methyltransferase [Elusimicrobiota bacterium]
MANAQPKTSPAPAGAGAAGRRPTPPDWWRRHFTAETLAGYALGPKARREVQGLLKLAPLPRSARVLDLCCGAGRHAVLLAERGLRVTGLDIQPGLLEAARATAARRGVELELVRGDARRLRYRARFDAVFNLFTSFGYFATEAEDLALLLGVRRALKRRGVLVLDLLNKEWLVRHFEPAFSQPGEGNVRRVINRLSFDFALGRLANRRTFVRRDGSRRSMVLSIRVYTLVELRRLLERAGLRAERVWGGFDGRPYGPDTFRMIVRARRIK